MAKGHEERSAEAYDSYLLFERPFLPGFQAVILLSPLSMLDHINLSDHAASVEDISVLDTANNDLLIHKSLL